MAGNDGAATLFAVALRVARLAADGTTPAGPNNLYVTDTLVQLDFTPTYQEGERITQRNGQGQICLDVKQPDSFTGVTINRLQICAFDPELTEMLAGGAVLLDGAATPNTRGYAAPAAGTDPTPNGVSLEVWTRRYVNNQPAALPFAHWVFPRVKLRQTARSLGSAAQENAFEGIGEENNGWGNGPTNDWTAPSDRAYQWVSEAAAPASALGYLPTPVQTA